LRIGLLADIHANYPSLIKALQIFKQAKVDKILCAGDLVEKGEQGDEVVALIRELNIPCVLGNHDEMAPSNQQWVKDNMDLSHTNAQNLLLKPSNI
jgi:predicted phosphodiesterase